jgi:nucleoside-diphosphate-sugar epimerase
LKVTVAGATGFLGRHLCKELISRQHDVRAIVRSRSNPALLQKNVDVTVLSTWSADALAHAIGQTEVLVDLVGLQGGEDIRAAAVRESNLDVTAKLISAAVGRVGRFVLVSSVRVYGVGNPEPISEETPRRPNTEYGRAKALAEDLVQREMGKDSAILRLSEVFGPGDQRSMIFRTLRLLQRGVRMWPGSGDNLVHPCYLNDAISGITLAVEGHDVAGPYIIAGLEAASFRTIVDLAAGVLNVAPPRWFIPTPAVRLGALIGRGLRSVGLPFPFTVSQADTLCDHRSYDLSRTRAKLGYLPRVSLADGLRRTVAAESDAGGQGSRL